MSTEVDDLLKRISAMKGVVGSIIVNGEGIAIKTTFPDTLTLQYTALMAPIVAKAHQVVHDMDKTNELNFLRIRSQKNEILLVPDKDFIFIVVQEPVE